MYKSCNAKTGPKILFVFILKEPSISNCPVKPCCGMTMKKVPRLVFASHDSYIFFYLFLLLMLSVCLALTLTHCTCCLLFTAAVTVTSIWYGRLRFWLGDSLFLSFSAISYAGLSSISTRFLVSERVLDLYFLAWLPLSTTCVTDINNDTCDDFVKLCRKFYH